MNQSNTGSGVEKGSSEGLGRKVLGGLLSSAVVAALIGLAATVIGVLGNRQNTLLPIYATQTAEGRATALATCHASGTVYNRDNNRVLEGVQVGYVPPGSAFTDEERFQYMATTGPDGRFSLNCGDIPARSFPVVIALKDYGWGGCIKVTEQEIRARRRMEDINLFVSDKAQTALGRQYGQPKNNNCEMTK